jgi:hypothetical protein
MIFCRLKKIQLPDFLLPSNSFSRVAANILSSSIYYGLAKSVLIPGDGCPPRVLREQWDGGAQAKHADRCEEGCRKGAPRQRGLVRVRRRGEKGESKSLVAAQERNGWGTRKRPWHAAWRHREVPASRGVRKKGNRSNHFFKNSSNYG